MGDDWRNYKISSRPPRPLHFSVPSWEKTFCTSVCSIPWKAICSAKDSLDVYTNIAKWDDSAALEAFQDAKARYWAEINRLPYDTPLPDPNIYIDELDDHTAVIDAELVADLYRKPPPRPPDEDRDDSLWNLPIKPTGWGDPEDGNTRVEDGFVTLDAFVGRPLPAATGWGPVDDNIASDPWDENGQWDDSGADGGGSWRGTADKQRVSKHGSPSQFWINGNAERGGRNGMKRNGHSSRFPKARHQVNDNERTVRAGKPLASQQWKPKRPCGPIDGQISNHGAWHREKI